MIEFAILGLLDWQPLSGYDLKKMIAASTIFYWSGNNNQIYRTLVQLHEEGLVTPEIRYQDNLPAKKVYFITPAGQEKLHQWVLSRPELPEVRHPFLIHLAWAESASDAELDALLEQYTQELQAELWIRQETARRKALSPGRSPRETCLWDEIYARQVTMIQSELDWVGQIQKKWKEMEDQHARSD